MSVVVVALAAVPLLPVTGEKPGRLRGKHFARRGWEILCVGVVSYLKGGGREGGGVGRKGREG